MQIKKETYEKLVDKLKRDIIVLERKRNSNRYTINKLAEEQVSIKQEQTILVDTIRSLEIKKKYKLIT